MRSKLIHKTSKKLLRLFSGLGLLLIFLTACGLPAAPAATEAVPPAASPTGSSLATQAGITPAAINPTATIPAAQPSATRVSTAAQSAETPTAAPTETPAVVKNPVWKELTSGLTRPTDLAEIPDGSDLLVVVEQIGTIRVMKKTGELMPEPFIDLTDRVGTNGTERGLLGIGFHPKYADNGYFYVNYTDRGGNTVVARFTGKPGATGADPASEKILLQVKQPYPNHNGGGVVFGPDGYLYLSLGDGGSGGDPQNRAQSLSTLLGKILRIDVDHGDPYTIPADNPFANGGGLPEIWAYGLRNPWRFSFDKATGDLYIADVGQNLYEEINFVPAGSPDGLNFGWNYREGLHAYKDSVPAGANFVDPVWEYSHDQGCSITGGFVYRGQAAPQLQGTYVYSDYCSGRIWGLTRGADGKWTNQVLTEMGASISAFGQDLAGDLYVLEHSEGRVMRLE